jgi:hypothetical protein
METNKQWETAANAFTSVLFIVFIHGCRLQLAADDAHLDFEDAGSVYSFVG